LIGGLDVWRFPIKGKSYNSLALLPGVLGYVHCRLKGEGKVKGKEMSAYHTFHM